MEEYSIVRLRGGAYSVRAGAFAEAMHPGIGPEAEAEALYVRQTGLLERLLGHRGEFVIWDIGLGAAANVLTALRRTSHVPSHLRVVSFDDTLGPLAFARQHPVELPYLAGFQEEIGGLLERRRVTFVRGPQSVDWSAVVGDFPSVIQTVATDAWPRPHLIMYDPFSPARNPAMWTLPLFERLYQLLDPHRPCLLATYSRSTVSRVTLLLAGFRVGAGLATGFKEETTVAANVPELIARPLDRRWLERALRSDSAEPLRTAEYRKLPLTPDTRGQLVRHPQFQSADASAGGDRAGSAQRGGSRGAS